MNKYVFTFGSGQLTELDGKARPNDVMLIIEDENERSARQTVVDSFIGLVFCTSYPYEPYAQQFKDQFNMHEYSLDDLIRLKDEK